MKKIIFISMYGFLSATLCFAQSDESLVKEVVDRMFKGMQLGDSAMVHSVFHESVTMASAFKSKDGNPVLRKETSIADFLKAVGTPHAEAWNEEIWNVEVKIDGDLAQVWCDYAFYVGKKFSHCGIDAFHLYKTTSGWKIFHLSDTRRSTNCTIPNSISDKYK